MFVTLVATNVLIPLAALYNGGYSTTMAELRCLLPPLVEAFMWSACEHIKTLASRNSRDHFIECVRLFAMRSPCSLKTDIEIFGCSKARRSSPRVQSELAVILRQTNWLKTSRLMPNKS